MDQMKKQKIEEIERKNKLERLKVESDPKPAGTVTDREKAALKSDMLEMAKRKKIEEIERKQLLD